MFQLVLQFAPWDDRAFDDLIRLEDLVASVLESGEVDGHDLGSGEANIFVITDKPDSALQASLPVISEAGLLDQLSAAYRALHGDEYTRVWPAGDTSRFAVK